MSYQTSDDSVRCVRLFQKKQYFEKERPELCDHVYHLNHKSYINIAYRLALKLRYIFSRLIALFVRIVDPFSPLPRSN